MKINPKLGKNPADLSSMKFATMKKLLKQDLKRLEKTSIDSPTMFMLTGAYDYPDKKGVALPIIGRQTIDWKLHAKNEVIKRDTGCIGRVYFNNINADGQKVIVFDVARGKGKAKIGKLEKGLKKIVSQSTHQLIFNSVDEAVLDQLEAVMDAAGDTLDEDIDDLADTENESDLLDEGDVNIDTKTQSYDMLLSTNLTKLSAQFVPVRDAALKGETNDAEDVELLLDYANEWLELYGEADTNAKTKFAPRLPQVETIKAFATKLMGAPANATAQAKSLPAQPNFDASKKALEIGLEMEKAPYYQPGNAYIPFTGKVTGKQYKKGDVIDEADRKGDPARGIAGYNPTWCNQFAYDMTDKVVGNNSPFNFLPGGKGWTNANALADFAEAADGVLFDKIGKFEEAWQLANAGKLVYFLSKDKIGHVSTAAPSKPEQMIAKGGDKFGMVIQAGARVGNMHMFKVWGDPVKAGVKIFMSRMSEPLPAGQQQDPNLFLKIYKTISKPVGKGYEVDPSKGPQRDIKTVQQLLVNAGQNIGSNGQFKNGVDGVCSKSTSATIKAIENVQREAGLPVTGFVVMNDATWNLLYGKSKTIIETPTDNPNAAALENLNTGGTNTDTPAGGSNISSTVQKGSKGADVVTVQKLLLKNGADLGKWGADGDAGSATDAAIRAFQTKNGLPVTGTVEPNSPTWLALNGQTPAPTLAPENVQLQMGAGVSGIPAAQMRVLQEILAKAGEPTARITSYRRSPEQQAQVMFNNIIRDGAARNQTAYKNPAAAAQVVKAFNDAMNAGKDGAGILAAVTAAVNAVGAANLSDHCAANPAIDIDPKSLKNTGNFNAALQADSRVKAIMPPADSTYHLLINA